MPAKVVTIVNGLPVLVTNSGGEASSVDFNNIYGTNPANLRYEESISYPSGLAANTQITLPNGKTYQDVELEVRWNGFLLNTLEHYSYVGTAPRTKITLNFPLNTNDRISFRIEDTSISTISAYYEIYLVPSTIVAGTPVAIPNGKTYSGAELDVFLNGIDLKSGEKWNVYGTLPRTQITFTENLAAGDVIVFRTEASTDAAQYDENYSVVAYMDPGAIINLPNNGNYYGSELQVELDGTALEESIDYNYLGLTPRFQIQMLIDLHPGETLRFKKERPQ